MTYHALKHLKGQLKGPVVFHTHKNQDLGQKGVSFKLKLDLNEILFKVGVLYLKKVHMGV